eukprot:jgi/Mesvir1/11662/Mv00059-RA.1
MTETSSPKQAVEDSATQEELNKMRKEMLALEAEKAAWESLVKKFDATLVSGRLQLDVGGTVFATSLSTLLSQEGTFFSGMFGGRFDPRMEEDGTYFIDRDPSMFHHILNFLRAPEAFPSSMLDMSAADLRRLEREAEFYCIISLLQQIADVKAVYAPKFTPSPADYTLCADDTTVTKVSCTSEWDGIVLGTPLPTNRNSSFCFTFRNMKSARVRVGVAPASTSRLDGGFKQPGWSAWTICARLELYSGPPSHYHGRRYAHGTLHDGDTLAVIIDRAKRTIAFVHNGTNLGVAYANVFDEKDELCPAVCICRHPGPMPEVTILSDYSTKV